MVKFKPSKKVTKILDAFGIKIEVLYVPVVFSDGEREELLSVEGIRKVDEERCFYIGVLDKNGAKKNYLAEFDLIKDWHMSFPFRSEMLFAIAMLLEEIKEFKLEENKTKIKEILEILIGKVKNDELN